MPSSRGAEVPRRVDQIVLKALAKNPQERYQNASEFEKDLHAVLYTYQPSPGPADLAIYMHRLLEAPPASDDEIDAAFDKARDMSMPAGPVPAPAPEVSQKRGKGLVIAQSGEASRHSVHRADHAPRARAAPPGGRERGRAARGGRIPEEPRRPRGRHRNRRGGAPGGRPLRDDAIAGGAPVRPRRRARRKSSPRRRPRRPRPPRRRRLSRRRCPSPRRSSTPRRSRPKRNVSRASARRRCGRRSRPPPARGKTATTTAPPRPSSGSPR